MNPRAVWRVSTVAWLMAVSLAACGHHHPTEPPENRYPVIFSVTMFPTAIGPRDSAILVCNAMDPDADTLVYDWVTDARLRIRGSFLGTYLFNTRDNAQVLYYGNPHRPNETAWIQCTVRDRRGGGDARIAYLTLHDSTLTLLDSRPARMPPWLRPAGDPSSRSH